MIRHRQLDQLLWGTRPKRIVSPGISPITVNPGICDRHQSGIDAVLGLSLEADAARQRDRGTQTTCRPIAEHDVSAVRGDRRPHQCEAQADTARLATARCLEPIKRFEHAFQLVRRQRPARRPRS